ncbi:MAG: carbamoyltransferase, partial [Actinomycetes bacterium]
MTTSRSVILGVSCDYHDAAAALIVDGRVVAAAEEERFSRVKHDANLPRGAIAACLEVAGCSAADVDRVVFYEKPLLVVARYLASRQRSGPAGMSGFVSDVPRLLSRNLMVGYRLRRTLHELGAKRPPIVEFVDHHRSHAAAAFYPAPFDSAAVVTVDGIGEWATATISHGHKHRLTMVEEQRYPNSLGLMYSFVTAWCGFRPNDGEYKLMGLAPYGSPTYVDALRELIDVGEHGGVRVDARRLRWFGQSALKDRRLQELLGGPARESAAPLTQREADLAASIQRITEDAMFRTAERAHELTGESALCMAGGVALNCVANGRLLREGPFDDLWVQPAAGDSGSAVGAALALWHEEHTYAAPTDAPDGMSGAYLGPNMDDAAAAAYLGSANLPVQVVADDDELIRMVAQRIADGAVVAWCNGRMEFGPRALGHRSILADPRSPTVARRLNVAVKGRESFRPFAPAVLAEEAADWFHLDRPSPYMLLVVPLRE